MTIVPGCREADNGESPQKPDLLKFLEGKDEVTFIDSSPGGVMSIEEGKFAVYCELRFQKNHRVYFRSGAYSFCRFEGSFQVVDGDIIISFDRSDGVFTSDGIDPIKGESKPIKFPPLNLIHTPDGIQLIRKDRERHLKEHWNVYDGVKIFPLVLTSQASATKHVEPNPKR